MERQNIAANEQRLDQMASQSDQLDLSPILNLIDSATGSKIAQGYKNPGSDKLKIEMMKQNLGRQRMGAIDDQLQLLRTLDQREQNQFNREIAQEKLALAKDKAKEKSAQGKLELTPGQKEVDKKFAKEYVAWDASGGFANVAGNLDKLREVGTQLDAKGDLTNTVMPKAMRDIFNPESSAAQEQVESVVQQSLKQILGAQFTEKEAKQLIERSYNPRLPDDINRKKLDGMIKQLETMGKAKQEAMDYYTEKGTLKGFKGKSDITLSGMEAQFKKDLMKESKKEETKSELDALSEELGL